MIQMYHILELIYKLFPDNMKVAKVVPIFKAGEGISRELDKIHVWLAGC